MSDAMGDNEVERILDKLAGQGLKVSVVSVRCGVRWMCGVVCWCMRE